MPMQDIDAQFANTQTEIRNLMRFMQPHSTAGGYALEALQGMVDALGAIQADTLREGSYTHAQIHPTT